MRKFLALCGAVLCFSVVAAAQNNYAALAVSNSSSTAATPRRSTNSELYSWQLAISYEFLRFDVSGADITLHGFNTSLTHFRNNWFGFEGDVGPAFGSTPGNITIKYLWYGGGPRLAYRRKPKFEPWAHGLFGGAHLFPQTASGSLNAIAYVVGGGVDFKLNPRVYWRIQGDFSESHFFNDWQKHAQFKTGLVFNF